MDAIDAACMLAHVPLLVHMLQACQAVSPCACAVSSHEEKLQRRLVKEEAVLSELYTALAPDCSSRKGDIIILACREVEAAGQQHEGVAQRQ